MSAMLTNCCARGHPRLWTCKTPHARVVQQSSSSPPRSSAAHCALHSLDIQTNAVFYTASFLGCCWLFRRVRTRSCRDAECRSCFSLFFESSTVQGDRYKHRRINPNKSGLQQWLRFGYTQHLSRPGDPGQLSAAPQHDGQDCNGGTEDQGDGHHMRDKH